MGSRDHDHLNQSLLSLYYVSGRARLFVSKPISITSEISMCLEGLKGHFFPLFFLLSIALCIEK